MTKLLQLWDEIISPRGVKCLCCDELSYGELLCHDCQKALKAMRLPADEIQYGDICCAYRYDGIAKDLVLYLKEDCLADAAHALASGMWDVLKTMHLPENTVMTWVSMPKLRRKQRGIDHGRELCTALSRLCGFPARKILSRKGRIHTQRGLSKEKRLTNLSGTFVCSERLDHPVLLVDDVLTTGATAAACTDVLLKAGATSVYVIAATKASPDSKSFKIRKVDLYGFYPS